MSKTVAEPATTLVPKKGWKRVWLNFKRHWQLHLLLLIPTAYLILFNYVPLYGIQIAWKEYSPRRGITGSEWVGWKWFEKVMTNHNFRRYLWNTIILSLQEIAIGFPLPIIIALMINTLKGKRTSKVLQTIFTAPHFISLVVLVGMLQLFFGRYGLITAAHNLYCHKQRTHNKNIACHWLCYYKIAILTTLSRALFHHRPTW